MPSYIARRNRKKQRARRAVTGGMTRDRRILKRWAVAGSPKDFARLRALASTPIVPEWVDDHTMASLQDLDRASLLKHLHNAAHGGANFLDGLLWVLSLAPSRNFPWVTKLSRMALRPFEGDSLTEVDSEYAKLVQATYQDPRPGQVDTWRRDVAHDSEYLAVWRNEDGHVLVAVRGTELSHLKDLGEDLLILAHGTPTDILSKELRRVFDSLPGTTSIDVASHSLGTALVLRAYERDGDLQQRVQQTYCYNPTMSPLSSNNVTARFEKDPNVRYFISLSDPVSSGAVGTPANVVYRSGNMLAPLHEHDIGSWVSGTQMPPATLVKHGVDPPFASGLGPDPGDVPAGPEHGGLGLSFGDDDFGTQLDAALGQALTAEDDHDEAH